jgi:ribosomal protein L37E
MSTSRGYVDCPQCGFGRAIRIYDNRDRSADTMCTPCGHEDKWALSYSNGSTSPRTAFK